MLQATLDESVKSSFLNSVLRIRNPVHLYETKGRIITYHHERVSRFSVFHKTTQYFLLPGVPRIYKGRGDLNSPNTRNARLSKTASASNSQRNGPVLRSPQMYSEKWNDFFQPRLGKERSGSSQLEVWLPCLFLRLCVIGDLGLVAATALGWRQVGDKSHWPHLE